MEFADELNIQKAALQNLPDELNTLKVALLNLIRLPNAYKVAIPESEIGLRRFGAAFVKSGVGEKKIMMVV